MALCNHSVSAPLNPLRKREFFFFFLQAEEHVCVSLPRCLARPLHVRHASCHESVLAASLILCTTVKLDLLSLNCWNVWHSHSCWAASRVTDLLLLYSSQLKSQLCGPVICLGDWDVPPLPLCSSLSLSDSSDLSCPNCESWWAPLVFSPLLISAGAQCLLAQHFSSAFPLLLCIF